MAKKLLTSPFAIQFLFLLPAFLPSHLGQAQSLPAPFQFIQNHHYLGRNFSEEQFSLAAAEGAAKLFHPAVLLLKQQTPQKSPAKTQENFSLASSSTHITTISKIDFSSSAIATQILSALRQKKNQILAQCHPSRPARHLGL